MPQRHRPRQYFTAFYSAVPFLAAEASELALLSQQHARTCHSRKASALRGLESASARAACLDDSIRRSRLRCEDQQAGHELRLADRTQDALARNEIMWN
jgi:hypothetical protein